MAARFAGTCKVALAPQFYPLSQDVIVTIFLPLL